MGRANGGIVGAFADSGTTTAPGRWSMNDAAWRASRITTGGGVAVWPQLKDANFASVVGLYHFNSVDNTGAAGGGLYTDSSSKALHLGIAGSGPELSTTTKKFGLSSLPCTAAGTCYATHATNANYNFSTSDFVIEGWAYVTSTAGADFLLVDMRTSGASVIMPALVVGTGGVFKYFLNGSYRITSASSVVTTNAWFHWALAKVSGTSRLYWNFAQAGADYTDANTYTQGLLTLGAAFNGSSPAAGYLDEVRLTNGSGRGYSGATITAITTPFPDY